MAKKSHNYKRSAIKTQPARESKTEGVRICQSQHGQQGTGRVLRHTGSLFYRKIENNPLWEFAGMYADEAATGTKVKGRRNFRQ